MLEKETSVGLITEDFLLMKFYNLLSEKNIKRENEMMKRKSSSNTNTLG